MEISKTINSFSVNTDQTKSVDETVARYTQMQGLRSQIAMPQGQSLTGLNGEKNIEFILARLRQIEQQINGATIAASCNTSDSTITVTLTWGS